MLDDYLENKLLARPLAEAEKFLQTHNIPYILEYTKPTKSFFPLDEDNLYVLRWKKELSSKEIKLTLASKQKRRCEEDGI